MLDDAFADGLFAVAGHPSESAWIEARVTAIEALAALYQDASRVPRGSPPVETAVSHWEQALDDPALTVRAAAYRALRAHGLAPDRFPATDLVAPADADADARSTLDGVRGLSIATDHGDFRISFVGVDAPQNQANLVQLAAAGFFEGTTWHRVVPGFVTQGGDPRGDGYGGPGRTVPCELSNLTFGRGAVGMALAGRDTGGSQFFITHAAAPHLDGRYTLVGHVDEGMPVVDRLLVGDVIHRVEVVRER
ncbi:MAG: peptidylprolyl isomerase [Myxococcales bacterium FL481]|nr:MAG: peptidylprolyl isomerase [Myxococcales bacterium FL481]